MVQIPFGIHLGVPENCVYPAVMVIFFTDDENPLGFAPDPSHRIPCPRFVKLSQHGGVPCRGHTGERREWPGRSLVQVPYGSMRVFKNDFCFVYTKYVFPGSASQAFAQHFNTAFRYLQPAVQRALEVGMCDPLAFQK